MNRTDPHRTRRVAVSVSASLACLVAAATVALGQVETELTPRPNPSTQWTVLGGAEFGGDGTLNGGAASLTPFDVDFFSAAFSTPANPGDESVGLFGGWECPGSPSFEALSDCDSQRRPVVYGLKEDENGDRQFTRMDLPTTGADGRGYVSAIAWIDDRRALAVGGTGVYPRRETPTTPTADPAGSGRAWLYEDGTWVELSGDRVPAHALTALDCPKVAGKFVAPDVPMGRCLAGGFGELWWWDAENDRFDVDDPVTAQDMGDASALRFRVRQVRFTPGTFVNNQHQPGMPMVVAVTSGCCRSDPAPGETAGARLLRYPASQGGSTWASESFPLGASEAEQVGAGALPDSYFSVFLVGSSIRSSISSVAVPGPSGRPLEAGSRIVWRVPEQGLPPLEHDPDQLDRKLDELRLLAVDGDFAGQHLPTSSFTFDQAVVGPDGLFDWAVGGLKETGRGVAYTTVDSFLPLPSPLTCADALEAIQEALLEKGSPNCDVAPSGVSTYDPQTSKKLVGLPTYTLNAFSFVPGVGGGEAWAVGDRGALVRLGGAGVSGAGNEPNAPKLRPTSATPLTSDAAFDPLRPVLDAEPGEVPPLAAQPVDQLDAPAIEPYGTPDPTRWHKLRRQGVGAIALSRDGTEGWAVGPGRPYYPKSGLESQGASVFSPWGDTFTLQHFDGSRWVACDVDGLRGAYEADPACAPLEPLRRAAVFEGTQLPPTIWTVTRIPFERDEDASNDEDFEAVAVGSTTVDATGRNQVTMLAYRDGAWRFDDAASAQITGTTGAADRSDHLGQIVFTRPDDGWLLTYNDLAPQLYHYGPDPTDEEARGWPHGRWVECTVPVPPAECGTNAGSLLSGRPRSVQLAAAGDMVFLAGERPSDASAGQTGAVVPDVPFVYSKERGQTGWELELDADASAQEFKGTVFSLSVVELEDGETVGWLAGRFGAESATAESTDVTRQTPLGPSSTLLRRDASGTWSPRTVKDAADAYISYAGSMGGDQIGRLHVPRLVSFRDADGSERSFIMPARAGQSNRPYFPPLEYDPESDRWGVLAVPWLSKPSEFTALESETKGIVTAAAPDGHGGLWMAGLQAAGQAPLDETGVQHGTFFYRYSDRHRRPVFDDAPSPITEPITGMVGTPDGGVWVSTHSDRLYHYDRLKGWERTRIRGWDPGRVVTNPSRVLAIAVNASGVGVAVGDEGRVADISSRAVVLNPASGRRCIDNPPPCGAARDLRAAAVAPDGSAMIGGDKLTLMWRPAGGDFSLITRPRLSPDVNVRGVSMPDPAHAWVALDNGEVWAGELVEGGWRWDRETNARMAADERQTGSYPDGRAVLHAVAIDSSGRGIAVGERGAMLERSEDGSWRRLKTGSLDHLYSIALPPSGYGDGTLVGGGIGVILTRHEGQFHVVRPADITDPVITGPGQLYSGAIVGLTLAGGMNAGDVEAWAASQVDVNPPGRTRDLPPFALHHYASSDDPLLNPDRRVQPQPDTPAPEPGEITLAAFGRSECHLDHYCTPFQGSNHFNERVNRGIQSELRERRERIDGPFAAIFTGDISNMPGRSQRGKAFPTAVGSTNAPLDTNVVHDAWRDLMAKPLADDGIPVFAIPGKMDLSRAGTCVLSVNCVDTIEAADAGLSKQWRETFADMPAPWGNGDAVGRENVELEPVRNTGVRVEVLAGANTHYAVDVTRDGEAVARLIFVDNSFARSMTTGEASQNPVEAQGGQAAWLERMLCIRAETCTSGGTREPGQPAIVISNAPSYSYGPGGLDGVQSDASAFEALLLRHKATAAIAGRIGWNGLYYTIGAGIHTPCPGGAYPSAPPTDAREVANCGETGAAQELPEVPGGRDLAEALRGLGAPVPPQADDALGAAEGLTAMIPTVIASSAGGRFGPTGGDDGEAGDGFWHGYSIVRVRKSGEVIVEQRPIFDWIGIEAQEHTLRPGQRVTLRGYGREPVGTDVPVRINRIDSPAITHRYDLVLADESRPYLPKEDAEGNYTPVDPAIATIGEQDGVVRVKRGRQARTYALAILSVGDKAASYPLVFEPSRSFRPRPAPVATVRPPAPQPKTVQQPPPVRILPTTPTSTPPNPPPPPPITSPTIGNLNLPSPPSLPAIPGAPSASPTVQPPPPAPPPPPAASEALPLSLQAPVSAVSIVPTVIPPTPPPINPAPPGGSAARKEAKQRQAATAKSEEGGGDPAANPEDAQPRTNMGDSPNSATRLTQSQPQRYSFTAVQSTEQASAWSRGALYGGMTAVMAAILAMGWAHGRPRPRRRDPILPAPAWNRVRQRQR